MSQRPAFPPLFRPFAVTPDVDPFERAIRVATEGAEPGTLLWSIGTEAAECAIVLAPEQALEPSLPVVLVAGLALADALGGLVPPLVAVTFGWPDRVEINGRVVGGVRMLSAGVTSADEVPEWMVVGFGVACSGSWAEEAPDDQLQRTTLADEGCGEVLAVDLLEGFARHFLAWLDRWQQDGVGPMHQAWLARASRYGEELEVVTDGQAVRGTFVGLTDSGGLRLAHGDETRSVPLEDALAIPTWAL